MGGRANKRRVSADRSWETWKGFKLEMVLPQPPWEEGMKGERTGAKGVTQWMAGLTPRVHASTTAVTEKRG